MPSSTYFLRKSLTEAGVLQSAWTGASKSQASVCLCPPGARIRVRSCLTWLLCECLRPQTQVLMPKRQVLYPLNRPSRHSSIPLKPQSEIRHLVDIQVANVPPNRARRETLPLCTPKFGNYCPSSDPQQRKTLPGDGRQGLSWVLGAQHETSHVFILK